MNWRNRLFAATLAVLTLGVSACSKEQGSLKAKGTAPTAQQTANSIEEYGKSYTDKARKTQQLGEDRTKGIDDAINKMNEPQ